MALLIKDIFTLNLMKNAELIAGKKGAEKKVIWVNMMEILDQFDSLQKGELLITTGFGLQNQEKNKDLIKKLYEKGLSGLAIQPGYYIEEIPNYLINDANRYDFPLIKIPKKLTFSHVTRAILKELGTLKETTQKREDNNILSNILDNKKIDKWEEKYIKNILKEEENYKSFIMVVSVAHIEEGIVLKNDVDDILKKIKTYIKRKTPCLHVEKVGRRYAFLFSLESNKDTEDLIYNLNKIIIDLGNLYKDLSFKIGISAEIYDFYHISSAYEKAIAIENILWKIGARKGVFSYKDISFLQMFADKHSKDSAMAFMKNTLGPILEQEKIDKDQYLNVMRAYFIYGNISRAADELFLHRHTLKSKIEKIEKICDFNMRNYNLSFKYMLALIIYDLYQ